jgi:malonate decarboxylase beta subunit
MPRHSFFEASARERVLGLLDAGSFREFVPPAARATSPHLRELDQPVAFDDGLIAGAGTLDGRAVLVAGQEGAFLGGAVGEVHGAKLVGLLRRAVAERPAAVLILFDSGGVRLHEANAGLVAVSEILRAICAARAEGVRIVGLVGGAAGCFGGTGLVARCCDAIVMSEEGRLAMSGPEVIETVHGVEEFDARDRALVWRVTGGKHRYLLGEADRLVEDDITAFRAAAIELLDGPAGLDLADVEREHALLAARWHGFSDCDDAPEIWRRLGIEAPERVPMMDAAEFVATADLARRPA